jgi:hypothetical protein
VSKFEVVDMVDTSNPVVANFEVSAEILAQFVELLTPQYLFSPEGPKGVTV